MKKKRIISLILATTMAATVVVSGCGKSGDSEKTDDGKKKTEASDDKVLEFYHGYGGSGRTVCITGSDQSGFAP